MGHSFNLAGIPSYIEELKIKEDEKMQVKMKESWVLYDKPNDCCTIRFIRNGMEIVRIVFYFSGLKQDRIVGQLRDYFPITIEEEKQYLAARRESAKQRTRSLREYF